MNKLRLAHPLAITMWDFSWLERRWPGAGYEDWDRALDGLMERGYDAVRIDAYPHLVAADSDREWEILPIWNQQDWGSPTRTRVRVMPALLEFISKCADRDIRVGLSTWFQADSADRRRTVASPRAHAAIWETTLRHVEKAGLLNALLYVDFCNEWPFEPWAPLFRTEKPACRPDWRLDDSMSWMRESVEELRQRYPQLPLTYSFSKLLDRSQTSEVDVSFLDFLELHSWMASATDFYERVGYHYERFDPKGYENVAAHAERLYRSDPVYWQQRFAGRIEALALFGETAKKPLITTEGWAIVDYKDWPGLDWGWVKEFNAWAVERVAATGRWAAICTSNFCGPQFRGMWRDVEWHQRLTGLIHSAALPKEAK